ncbi:hypothetical protein VVT58_00380 [Sphingobium sp. SJ10-10]|uniref:hypothetical protein n=1 Tax=Sphingobium sp. SJ10-10 TaxID=3114999 RepID=UPI002E179938|nr:hypothetical protein [Sphingobium sp. SJ10-10]
MTDLLDLATRLEGACDITGKPIGRHMVDGMTKLAAAQIAIAEEEDDHVGKGQAVVIDFLTSCIANEAKLFDDLAALAKDAVQALREAARPLDLKGLAALMDTDEQSLAVSAAWHAGYNSGATEQASYEAGYTDAERDVMDFLIENGEVNLREEISRCGHRSNEASERLHRSFSPRPEHDLREAGE